MKAPARREAVPVLAEHELSERYVLRLTTKGRLLSLATDEGGYSTSYRPANVGKP